MLFLLLVWVNVMQVSTFLFSKACLITVQNLPVLPTSLSGHSFGKVTLKGDQNKCMNTAKTQQVYILSKYLENIYMLTDVHMYTCEWYPLIFTPCPLHVNCHSHPIWLGKENMRGNLCHISHAGTSRSSEEDLRDGNEKRWQHRKRLQDNVLN